jgi:hypothetical protein
MTSPALPPDRQIEPLLEPHAQILARNRGAV